MITRDELIIEQMKALRVLAFTVLGGMLTFFILSMSFHFSRGPLLLPYDGKNLIFGILLLVTLAFLFYARYYYRVRYQQLIITRSEYTDFRDYLDLKTEVLHRVSDYRTTMTLHYVLCEIPALMAMICFLLFGDFNFFLVPIMSLIEMFRKFPTKPKLLRVIGKIF